MGLRLVVKVGKNKGKEIALPEGETLVGRRKGCNIRLADARVSRQHCRIRYDGKTATIEDLDSANGTLVNGAKVKEAVLKPGDLLQIGGMMFSVAGEEVPDEAVAVMGPPPGEPGVSQEESIAGAMAAMALAEDEAGDTSAPIEINFSMTTPEPEAESPIPLEEADQESKPEEENSKGEK